MESSPEHSAERYPSPSRSNRSLSKRYNSSSALEVLNISKSISRKELNLSSKKSKGGLSPAKNQQELYPQIPLKGQFSGYDSSRSSDDESSNFDLIPVEMDTMKRKIRNYHKLLKIDRLKRISEKKNEDQERAS